MGRFFLGIVACLVLVPVLVLAWFRWGNPPVAVADHPFPFEKQIVHIPLMARIHRQMVHTPPIQATEANFMAGAHIYVEKCAFCHGFYGKPSTIGRNMYPTVPQLWQLHDNGTAVGVSNDPTGVTYWKVYNGIRLTGMPAFDHILTTQQMWQVSILLHNAHSQLPPEVMALVSGQQPPTAPTAAKKKNMKKM
jgi:mono/diheme cytochrome c family protein